MPTIEPSALAAQRAANAELAEMPHPDVRTPEGLAELRAHGPSPATTVLTPRDERIPGPGGALRLRVFTPDRPARGVVLRIHGGGFAVGTPEHDDRVNDRIARTCGLAVVSPAYRLAPEVTIREEIADCAAAARWAAAHAATGPLLLAGTSAGSHLALSTALRLRDDHPHAFARLAGLHLDCGRYDLAGTPSARSATDDTLLLTPAWLAGFAALAVPGADERGLRDPEVSPLHADLRDLPPALLTVGALDPLIDDSRLLAERLLAAGGSAQLEVWPEAPHSFLGSGTPLAELALERVFGWLITTVG